MIIKMISTKVMKIAMTTVLILAITGWIICNTCKSDLTETDKQALSDLESVLIKKHQKQTCLDNLSYLESVENSKGLLYCNENDAEIKEKRDSLLHHIAWEEYENVDLKIAEKIASNTWITAIEKINFLLSE